MGDREKPPLGLAETVASPTPTPGVDPIAATLTADPESSATISVPADPHGDTAASPALLPSPRPGGAILSTNDLALLPAVPAEYWTLGREIARGGMGRIVEARD